MPENETLGKSDAGCQMKAAIDFLIFKYFDWLDFLRRAEKSTFIIVLEEGLVLSVKGVIILNYLSNESSV